MNKVTGRELITIEEAENRGLVYTCISMYVAINDKSKQKIISEAAKEEKSTGIPCYPVISQRYSDPGLYVYAEPIYSRLTDYYRCLNFATSAKHDIMRISKELAEASNRYESNMKLAKEIRKELYNNGVKYREAE